MCGLAGMFGGVRDDDARRSAVRRMSDAICHRGPDDSGVCDLPRRGATAGTFAHRRLSILDLSPLGHQPMLDSAGSLSLVFNGEIYNFLALRAELEASGARFRSGSDTEVLLEGWARSGPAFLGRLRGMFALALWDEHGGRGYLARDGFGIKPLYLARVPGGVAFASEIRALMASGLVQRRIDRGALAGYLAQGAIPEPLSGNSAVRPLPAGSVIEISVDDGQVTLGEPQHFALALQPADRPLERRPAVAAALVRAALEDSIAHHLVSDVPVALFLSGGIDSSAVVALASRASARPLRTFTVTFAEQTHNEAGPASEVARRYGTEHVEVPLDAGQLLDSLPAAFRAMDQPSLDGLNTFAVSAAVRRAGYKVVLSGLGGDEMFAGYPSFRRARRIAPLWNGVSALRRPMGRLADAAARRGDPRAEKMRAALQGDDPARAAYVASRTLFGQRSIDALLADGGANGWEHGAPVPPAGLSPLQRVSWYELSGYMRNTLLRDSDVFSMAHGLELRVPFVDVAVAKATASVHDDLKLSSSLSKPLLLASLSELLPRAVWDRPKRGFELPFAHWLRHELHGEVAAALTSADRLSRLGLEAAEVRGVWDGFLAGRPGLSWSRPWALFTLVRWAEENDVSVSDDGERRDADRDSWEVGGWRQVALDSTP